jgi:class 3 adenylate cyclase/predicted ATPase
VDVGVWLRDLGLERYEAAFRDNEVDATLLPNLTAEDLKDLGVTLVGHRRRLLDAIDILKAGPGAELPVAPSKAGAARTVAPSEAERRQLTVMFVDLVGSTALSRELDPEELRDVIRLYQNAVAGEVTRFEGHIAKYMGDGVLAYFGWPKAHEDAAERAVRAGLAVAAAVGGLRTPDSIELAARVGIATGRVVVGDLVGEGAAQEQAVVGETPNLAARLQELAAAGHVVISESTAYLLGRLFDLAELGVHVLKGYSDPVKAYEVVGESAAESRFEALHAARLTAIVGREQEMGLLLDRWRLAKNGEGQVVELIGEAGIGKSRIVQDLREHLADECHLRIRYYCSPYHINSAFHPVIDQLSRAAGFVRDESPERKLDKLEKVLARAAARLGEVVPAIAALLTIPTEGRYPLLGLTPQRQKVRILEALLAQLEGLAAKEPILMLLEDMQWLDPTSLELFDQIVDRIERLPVLLVASFRPECTPRWLGYPHVTMFTLNRLGRGHAAEIIAHMTEGRGLPPSVVEHILARTDGVPLFVEELTNVVLESGLLRHDGERYALCGPLPPLAIPATLQDSLMARLDRLATAKEVAQAGAVIGRQFGHEILAAVVGLSEAKLAEALDQLVAAELLFRRGTAPNVTYSFKHALVQDTAYESLLRSKRQLLHARIAEALETRFPETVETEPELLARHCTHAGLVEQAVEHWKRAGQLAMARSATAEAIAHLEAALHILGSLPESESRDRQELSIQLAVGSAMVAAHGFAAPQTGTAYHRARELCERLNDIRQLFPVVYGLCLFHLYAADLGAADAASSRLLELAATSNDRDLLFFAHRAGGVSSYPAGKLEAARTHLERALSLYDPEEHRTPAFVYAFDPKVVCLDYLARTLFPLGFVEQALGRNDEAVAEARRIAHYNSLALPLFFGGTLRQLAGDRYDVEARADELVRLAQEERFRFWLAGGTILRGWAAADAGDIDGGVQAMQDGLMEWQATGAEYMVPYFLTLLAEVHTRSGRAADALRLLDEAAQRIERSGERWFQAEAHRATGEAHLALKRPDPAAAEHHYRLALKVAHKQGARLWALRAAVALGHLWQQQGKRDNAHHLLAPLYAGFTEGLSTPDLRRAKNLLATLTPCAVAPWSSMQRRP